MTNRWEELESELAVAHRAFASWTTNCMYGTGKYEISFLDILVLQILCRSDVHKRLVDICCLLRVEEQHTVNYSLKKLIKLELAEFQKRGKVALFRSTAKGHQTLSKLTEMRLNNLNSLIERLEDYPCISQKISESANSLRTLADIYDQALRHLIKEI